MKFKAAILESVNKPLIVDEIQLSSPLDFGQVLVKVEYSGICGKQLEEVTGKMGPDKFLPHLLGHEGFGEVLEKHATVTKVNIGDKVVLHWMKGSGFNSNTPTYLWNKGRLNAGWITTFNQFAVISENRLTRVDSDVDGSVACLLGCATSTGIGAVLNESNTKPYHKIAIIGSGGVGLNCVIGAKILNCQKIDCFDLSNTTQSKAKLLGAHNFYLTNESNYQENMYDKVFVTAPNKQAIELAQTISNLNGDIYLIGVPAPNLFVEINALKVHRGNKLFGASGGGIDPERDIPYYYHLHKEKVVNLKEIIDKEISLDLINNSIADLQTNKVCGRTIINLWKS